MMADRKPLSAEQKKAVALMPIGSSLLVIGLVLAVVIDGPARWFGWVLLAAGIALEAVILIRLLKLNKEDRS